MNSSTQVYILLFNLARCGRRSACAQVLCLLLFLCIGHPAQSQSATPGLVGFYTFCDCTASDMSGNNHHGAMAGTPQCVRGMRDYGLLFNQSPGSNGCGQAGGQYINLPDFGPIWSNGFTVCAWVRFDEIKNFERIIDFGNASGEAGGLPVWFGREGNSNTLTLESWINNNGTQARGTGRLTAPNAITNGSIEYYCATISGNTMRIYVNGRMVAERQGNPIANVSRTNNFIGRSNWCSNDPDFKGFMDEVRIYNRALSPQEIQDLYLVTNVNDFTANTTCNSLAADFSIANTSNIDSLVWNFGDAASGVLNKGTGPNASHRFTAPGTYPVQLIAYKPCLNDTVVKMVSVHEGIKPNLGNDFSLCPGTPHQLIASIPRATYLWQDGSTANSLSLNQPGLYWVQVALDGCTYRDSIQVNSLQKRVTQTIAICNGQNYLGYNRSGTYVDTFALANGCDSLRTLQLTVQASTRATAAKTICAGDNYLGHTTAGVFVDTLRYASGCDSVIQTTYLTINPRPVVTVNKMNDVDCIITTTRLTATGGAGYRWLPAAGLSNPFIANPVASPAQSTTYRVFVTAAGCTTEDSIRVHVNTGNAVQGYPVPTAFTPNNDGKNDCFGVPYWGNVSNFTLRIYNRWGAVVYATNNVNACWNGTFKGNALATGAYVYVISAQTMCGEVVRKGVVTLLR